MLFVIFIAGKKSKRNVLIPFSYSILFLEVYLQYSDGVYSSIQSQDIGDFNFVTIWLGSKRNFKLFKLMFQEFIKIFGNI